MLYSASLCVFAMQVMQKLYLTGLYTPCVPVSLNIFFFLQSTHGNFVLMQDVLEL